MKKTFGMALALLLALAALVPTYAETAPGADRNLFVHTWDDSSVPNISGLAAIGNALYMLSAARVYRYLPGDEEPTLFADGVNAERLFEMDGRLYGFETALGQVTRLSDPSGAPAAEPLCTLNLESMYGENREESAVYLQRVFSANGRLYATVNDYSAMETAFHLYEYELRDGAEAVLKKTDRLSYLAPYRDGLLIGVAFSEYVGNEKKPALLIAYDPATETEETLSELGEDMYGGALVDPQSGSVFFSQGSALYQMADVAAAPALCAYLPERLYEGEIVRLENGTLAARGDAGVYLRAPNPDAAAFTLIIGGEYGSQEHTAVAVEHPELSLSVSSDYMQSMEEFTSAMISGAGSMDVLKLSMANQPVQKLMEKGYALDLSAFAELGEIASRMDERFLTPLTQNGKLYALPVRTYASVVSVNRVLWTETLGLPLDELPSTYQELLDFIANYSYDYGEEHDDVMLADSWNLKEDLLRRLLESEVAYQQRQGADMLAFDTPRFRGLMGRLGEMDFSDISLAEILGENATEDEMNEYYSRRPLFSMYYGADGPVCLDEDSEMTPLVLALDEGLEPVIPVDVTVLLVNPRSEKPDKAAAYIASYLGHLDTMTAAVVLFSENNDPVMNPNFESSLREQREWIAKREEALKTAAEENQAEIRDEIKWMKESLAELEKTGGVLLSGEQIAAYREQISPYLYPATQTPLTTFDDEASANAVQSLLAQFSQGAIDADAFVRELDGRVRLMMLENQ